MKIVLVGKPRSGKTTIIKKLASFFLPEEIAGFYTEEILYNNERIGFELVDVKTGKRDLLAHKNISGLYKIGRYGVMVENLENFLKQINPGEKNARLTFIDEVGKMECLSEFFRKTVLQLLEKPSKVVFTAPLKGTDFIEEFKQKPGLKKIYVTAANRELIFRTLLNKLSD